jgi:hypothetical protein
MGATGSTVHPVASKILPLFLAREAKSVAAGIFWGAIAAAVIRAVSSDEFFRQFLVSSYGPSLHHFSHPRTYLWYACVAAIAGTLFLALRYHTLFGRALRSWKLGVTSGLRASSLVITIVALVLEQIPPWHRMVTAVAALLCLVWASAWLHLRAARAKERVPTEEDVRVSTESRRIAGTAALESDDSIQTWAEDTLDRAALVDSLSIRILVSKSPAIALNGDFGCGKTSVLNLLREHLVGKAIVVAFNTWLPGSHETLTSYLMSDIASECQKEYFLPGMRSITRRFAQALGKSVPVLSGLPELLPAATQKDDIQSLRDSLARLPKRVVVLLDELDRMDKKEVRTLLKVVRGVSSLPNLSFVCASEQKKLLEAMRGDTVEERNRYFEKFFPVAIRVPNPDKDELKRAGIERVVRSLRARDWFVSNPEEEEFQKRLLEIWDQRLSPYCGTLRAIGLLANDVAGAAAPLRREVDSIDLVLIEALRRFEPQIYDLVSLSGMALTGGEGVHRGGLYYPHEERKRDLDRFREGVSGAFEDQARLNNVKAVLGELFPDYAKAENLRWLLRPRRKSAGSSDLRISDADIFPAYFRYELPKAIFSTLELGQFIEASSRAKDEEERREVFREKLRSMDRGSLIRDDFLRKLEESVPKADLPIAKSWVFAALTLATDLTYDFLSAFGESGYVMRMIIRVTRQIPEAERSSFLSECILASTDDTIPFRILNLLTNPQKSADYCDVKFAELYPAFIGRMRLRYGPEADAQHMDLSSSDPKAFAQWGDRTIQNVDADPKDRDIQRDFWLRSIGQSKAMLGEAFETFIMPQRYQYDRDPTSFIECKLPVEDLRRLFETLPEEEPLTKPQRDGLRRLREFLEGKYVNGTPFRNAGEANNEE